MEKYSLSLHHPAGDCCITRSKVNNHVVNSCIDVIVLRQALNGSEVGSLLSFWCLESLTDLNGYKTSGFDPK